MVYNRLFIPYVVAVIALHAVGRLFCTSSRLSRAVINAVTAPQQHTRTVTREILFANDTVCLVTMMSSEFRLRRAGIEIGLRR